MILTKDKYFVALFLTAITVFIFSCTDNQKNIPSTNKPDSKEKIKNLPPSDWPIFRGNPELTGKGYSGNLTLKGEVKLLWTVTPQKKSNKATSSDIGFSGTPVIKGNSIFLGGSNGVIYSISTKDGQLLWQTKTESSFEASPACHGELVFCGSLSGEMSGFAISDGTKKWGFKTEGRIVGAGNIAETDKGNFLVFGSYDNHVYCLDLSNGEKIWNFKSENYVNGTPAIFGKVVVFGGCDEKLRFLDISDGKELFNTESGSYIPGSPVMNNGKCFAALYDGEVICIDLKIQKLLWRFKGDSDNDTFLSSPAVEDSKVYVSSRGNMIYSINSVNGKKIWEFRGSAPFDAAPLIFGNMIVAASTDGIITLIDKKHGTLLSKYETGETFIGSPAVSGNRLFIASEEGTVFAFILY